MGIILLTHKDHSTKDKYFHLNDARFLGAKTALLNKHSYPIGKGKIDFSKILPYVSKGIVEIVDKDFLKPNESLDSYRKINKLADELSNFDRILMPLPKSAESFLDVALKASKKGTIIHFYDFLHDDEFCKAEEKIKKACKKLGLKPKILRTVRCGQHSPHVFRICVDFKV